MMRRSWAAQLIGVLHMRVVRRSKVIVATTLLVTACAPPNVDSLDRDIQAVIEDLAVVDAELQEYPSGLIGNLLNARKQTLGLTRDMLQQKRGALVYWIDLRYEVDGASSQPASPEQLESVSADIRKLEVEILASEAEARTVGGLIRTMTLAQVATQKLSLATLQLRYYASKHGVPIALLDGVETDSESGGAKIVIDDASQL
jgi:hypothetical protein